MLGVLPLVTRPCLGAPCPPPQLRATIPPRTDTVARRQRAWPVPPRVSWLSVRVSRALSQ
jgi:hypothetical protein